MDAAELIRRLKSALSSDTLSRKNRVFLEVCLPDLHARTLDPADRAELETIAAAFGVPTDEHANVMYLVAQCMVQSLAQTWGKLFMGLT